MPVSLSPSRTSELPGGLNNMSRLISVAQIQQGGTSSTVIKIDMKRTLSVTSPPARQKQAWSLRIFGSSGDASTFIQNHTNNLKLCCNSTLMAFGAPKDWAISGTKQSERGAREVDDGCIKTPSEDIGPCHMTTTPRIRAAGETAGGSGEFELPPWGDCLTLVATPRRRLCRGTDSSRIQLPTRTHSLEDLSPRPIEDTKLDWLGNGGNRGIQAAMDIGTSHSVLASSGSQFTRHGTRYFKGEKHQTSLVYVTQRPYKYFQVPTLPDTDNLKNTEGQAPATILSQLERVGRRPKGTTRNLKRSSPRFLGVSTAYCDRNPSQVMETGHEDPASTFRVPVSGKMIERSKRGIILAAPLPYICRSTLWNSWKEALLETISAWLLHYETPLTQNDAASKGLYFVPSDTCRGPWPSSHELNGLLLFTVTSSYRFIYPRLIWRSRLPRATNSKEKMLAGYVPCCIDQYPKQHALLERKGRLNGAQVITLCTAHAFTTDRRWTDPWRQEEEHGPWTDLSVLSDLVPASVSGRAKILPRHLPVHPPEEPQLSHRASSVTVQGAVRSHDFFFRWSTITPDSPDSPDSPDFHEAASTAAGQVRQPPPETSRCVQKVLIPAVLCNYTGERGRTVKPLSSIEPRLQVCTNLSYSNSLRPGTNAGV
ncbi:hypothetical protein SODALDRAFT_360589 [Sodiomyces alkalinus F11]|uniref:Uncharacterized protein n=1 Tax=Sodiomyces alkalinus (strain CBS 110278 / VKM F-3762 / F11) TaxID=1314773 RepID=A0A3N2PUR2_SODAK|nr:hypothetical protein SODALDRAFT_360589 [Sodiomyces alkalinus F11]ROT38247.1 hypothetical protein SODALDRAFT_360589 [Sodiomyces alkalinus F11]